MVHDLPLEIRDKDGNGTGKWRYCSASKTGSFAIGHCSQIESCTCSPNTIFGITDCEICQGKGFVSHPNPCPGHDTPEDACNHYREYLIDNARYDYNMGDMQKKCEICGTWTQHMAAVPMASIYHTLCDEHRNREYLDKVMSPVGESWHS